MKSNDKKEENKQSEETELSKVTITKLNQKDIKEIEADELVEKIMQQILRIK